MRRLKHILAWSQTVTVLRIDGSHHIGVYAIHTRHVGVDVKAEFKPRFLIPRKAVDTATPAKVSVEAATCSKPKLAAAQRDLQLDIAGMVERRGTCVVVGDGFVTLLHHQA